MKKIVTPLAAGGAPFTNETMETVFNAEIWTAMESILQGVSDPSATGDAGVIVSGCNITANGGNWDCSSGIVYIGGQFMAFAGFTNLSLPRYIVPASLAYTTKVWNNGTTNNFIAQQDATHQSGVPGSGQYISLTTTRNLGGPGGYRFENYVPGRDLSWIKFDSIASDVKDQTDSVSASSGGYTLRWRRGVNEVFVSMHIIAVFSLPVTGLILRNIPADIDAVLALSYVDGQPPFRFGFASGTGDTGVTTMYKPSSNKLSITLPSGSWTTIDSGFNFVIPY